MLGMSETVPPDATHAVVEVLSTLAQLGELTRLARLTVGGMSLEFDSAPGRYRRPALPETATELPDPIAHLMPPTEVYDDAL